jgi:hypothetical protein
MTIVLGFLRLALIDRAIESGAGRHRAAQPPLPAVCLLAATSMTTVSRVILAPINSLRPHCFADSPHIDLRDAIAPRLHFCFSRGDRVKAR